MEKVTWGIIGCGDVAESKSGPAFQKVARSQLLAVMRRNGEKAKDFAQRHEVPLWYDDVDALLQNPEINAVYIATPPASHLEITLKAIKAGKNIYLEKPMAISSKEAVTIIANLKKSASKLAVAHYRRRLPAFLKVKELLDKKAIGEVRFAEIKILQPLKSSIIAHSEEDWRTNPQISGGGYFHDLAPHQIDLMYHFFGQIEKARGFSANQSASYKAADIVNGIISFRNGTQFTGTWCFNVSGEAKAECCTMYGSNGTIKFSFFGDKVSLFTSGTKKEYLFEPVVHVQKPMIEATVQFFLGKGSNPCTAQEGLVVMEIIDNFCN